MMCCAYLIVGQPVCLEVGGALVEFFPSRKLTLLTIK